MNPSRRFPAGAEAHGDTTAFRVWAPKRKRVEVLLSSGEAFELTRENDGYFSGTPRVSAGALYKYRLDGGDAFPDPASRFQPEGPHGWSQVVDPAAYSWTGSDWRGASIHGQVIYEMHCGTFTREGTWAAAARELPELASVGITCVELMPVADFPGRFGWGYDGVGWYSPVAIYGKPDELRAFVNEAHRHKIAVILDVVYNHVGPDGNYLKQYSDDYFTDRYANEWGEAINYDGENSGPVREFVAANAAYWAAEYHMDGLRLDATQQIFDSSPENIMTALAREMRAAAKGGEIFIVAENESQHSKLVRPAAKGGYGLDGLWNDDIHHSAFVAATGRNEAYYTDYLGGAQEFVSAAKYGYLFQGQRYKWQAKRRGTPAWGLKPEQFVAYLDNHDQIANSGFGHRLHRLTSPAKLKALTAYLLLAPATPMLFQGQEFASTSPFLFFADHGPDLRPLVKEGRIQFLSQFRSLATPEMYGCFTDPGDPSTFERCKLNFQERTQFASIYNLHKDLLRLRRDDPVFRSQSSSLDGAVLSSDAFVLRFFGGEHGDRLLIVNLGRDLQLDPAPEPLLAPPEDTLWQTAWSSEDPAYGGCGTAPPESADNWRIAGQSAIVMRPTHPNETWQI
ncbi:MAG TPA: malto-oligosyltrehalose trehalohydrolase [Candidatus Limnocylindrales bacterium]|nr:malto-oligosyltrehalose trehalohydrolase [Candidatus Limnocylindrales bacterium]